MLISHEALAQELVREVLEGESFDPSAVPIVKWKEERGTVTLYLLAHSRPNVGKFFYDIISSSLIPGKRVHIPFFCTADFSYDGEYTIAKLVLHPEDLETALLGLPILEEEIKWGVTSSFHARRLLEVRGLSVDEKMGMIQEKIGALIEKKPRYFDTDLFTEMQHFFLICPSRFKEIREQEQITRLIALFYLFRKEMQQEMEQEEERRCFRMKLVKMRLHSPFGVKQVMGVVLGIRLLKESELFEEKHLVKAIKQCVEGVVPVQDSFFMHGTRESGIHTFYIEIEKENGKPFSQEEIGVFKKEMLQAVTGSVEHLVRPIFMPRNEEEVMRNIVALTHQLRSPKDIPQVMISFDEQTESELSFTVILLRVVFPDTPSLQTLFQNARFAFLMERVRNVGMIRKRYPKEASVFRVKCADRLFLREDQTVDFYKARKEVLKELENALGEVRDFNGGIIVKQVELLDKLKDSLGDVGQKHELLLERFFHSLTPVEMKSVLPHAPLRDLFLLLLEVIRGAEERVIQEKDRVYLIREFEDPSSKQGLIDEMASFDELVSVNFSLAGRSYLGYIYFSEDPHMQEKFLLHILASARFT